MGGAASEEGLIAIDVGNSRVKLGWFPAVGACAESGSGGALAIAPPRLPEPQETLGGAIEKLEQGACGEWLQSLASGEVRVVVASVSRPIEERITSCLTTELSQLGIPGRFTSLRAEDVPIEARVDEPSRVGVDRLLAALAATRLKRDVAPAIVVDAGTAITVDLMSADGAFEGGAILPGVRMSAHALHEQTDALPQHEMEELDASPSAIGKNTEQAIQAGLYWGAVGAVRELISRQRDALVEPPQVFLTGGAAPSVARLIGAPDHTVRYVPHLTLSGLAVAAQSSGPPT